MRRTTALLLTGAAALFGMTHAITDAPPATAERAAVAAPGIPIYGVGEEGTNRCTLGYADTSSTSRGRIAITAGHCGSPGTPVLTTGRRMIGRYTEVRADQSRTNTYGYAVIALNADVATSGNITPTFAINGHADAAPGDTVCLFGTTSGRRCGTVNAITPGAATIAGSLSAPGDSGGPVVRMSDRALVGILIGHDAQEGITMFEPIRHIEQLAGLR